MGRIVLICDGLYHAIKHAQQHPDEVMTLPSEISNQTVGFAVAIMQLGIDHKCALMPPPVTPIAAADDLLEDSATSADADEYSNITEGSKLDKRITSLLTYGLDVLDPSLVAQRKLMPPVDNPQPTAANKSGNRFPVDAARQYLSKLVELGLGELVAKQGQTSRGNRKPTEQFHKRNYSGRLQVFVSS